MPFEHCTPQSFTAVSIRTNAPAAPGLYGISNAREWIFIGTATDIRASLLLDLQQGQSELMSKSPTGFVFEICGAATWAARQDRLVMEYEPVCNRGWSASGAEGTR